MVSEKMDKPFSFGDQTAERGGSTGEADYANRANKPRELDHPCNGTFNGLDCERVSEKYGFKYSRNPGHVVLDSTSGTASSGMS
jgi:hypothetical protein